MQIEPCVAGLLHVQKTYPDLFVPNVVVMNVRFAQAFQTEHINTRPIDVSHLMSYIIGSIDNRLSTHRGDSTLVVALVQLPNHWFLMKIYVLEQQICILDSSIGATTLKKLDEEVKGIITWFQKR